MILHFNKIQHFSWVKWILLINENLQAVKTPILNRCLVISGLYMRHKVIEINVIKQGITINRINWIKGLIRITIQQTRISVFKRLMTFRPIGRLEVMKRLMQHKEEKEPVPGFSHTSRRLEIREVDEMEVGEVVQVKLPRLVALVICPMEEVGRKVRCWIPISWSRRRAPMCSAHPMSYIRLIVLGRRAASSQCISHRSRSFTPNSCNSSSFRVLLWTIKASATPMVRICTALAALLLDKINFKILIPFRNQASLVTLLTPTFSKMHSTKWHLAKNTEERTRWAQAPSKTKW